MLFFFLFTLFSILIFTDIGKFFLYKMILGLGSILSMIFSFGTIIFIIFLIRVWTR